MNKPRVSGKEVVGLCVPTPTDVKVSYPSSPNKPPFSIWINGFNFGVLATTLIVVFYAIVVWGLPYG